MDPLKEVFDILQPEPRPGDIKLRYNETKLEWEEAVDVITARARKIADWLGAVPAVSDSNTIYPRRTWEQAAGKLDEELHEINHVAFREGMEGAANLVCPICAAGYKLERWTSTIPSSPETTRYEHSYRRLLSPEQEGGAHYEIFPVPCPAAAIHRKLDEYADETGRETRQGSGGRPPQEPGPELIVNDPWWRAEDAWLDRQSYTMDLGKAPAGVSAATALQYLYTATQVGTLYPGAHAVIRDLTDAAIGCTDDGPADE